MSHEVGNLPISLYFDILSQKLGISNEMSLIVLALIERYFRSKSCLELREHFEFMSPSSSLEALGNESQIQKASMKCRMFEDAKIFWTGSQRFTRTFAKR